MIEYFTSVFTQPVALLGLLASIIVLISMCFDTRKRIGELIMRGFNVIGSALSAIYGLLLGPTGFGTILLNTPLIFISAYYFIKSWKDKT